MYLPPYTGEEGAQEKQNKTKSNHIMPLFAAQLSTG
jgi:hypothetical protein